MTVSATTREQQRLRDVAREYRSQGYEVLLEPTPDQLPSFLRSFRIDMLARNAEENVIVEVRTQESLTDAPELDAVAQALHNRDSWRFELVVTNPKDRTILQFKNATPLDYIDITYRLREARQLSDQEHGEAALLLAWSATEALLRIIADEESIAIPQANPSQLAKTLFTYGVLDKQQLDTFQAAFQTRNMVVHGYKEPQSLVQTLQQVLHLADQLLRRHTSD